MSLQRQQIEQIINIVPQNHESILSSLIQPLNKVTSSSSKPLQQIIKSLFFGLWNFDKMINQHNLSTKIATMMHQLEPQPMRLFFLQMMRLLTEKWNFIDHHRINKFMQLVRYLLREAIRKVINQVKTTNKNKKNKGKVSIVKVVQKEVDQLLMDTVFENLDTRCGIAYHVIDIYYETLHDLLQEIEQESGNSYKNYTLSLTLFQQHRLEHFRLHIIDKVYGKYKANTTLQDINQFNISLLAMAKEQERDIVRKNIYNLVGFLKNEEMEFMIYNGKREENRIKEKEARDMHRKKKISKEKKRIVRQNKAKRQEKNQQNTKKFKHKTTSGRKYEQRHLMNEQL